MGVRTCWPWETAATLPSARRRKGEERGGEYRGGRSPTACYIDDVDDDCISGSAISVDSTCNKDVSRKTGLAAGIVGNMDKIWRARDLSSQVKGNLYQSLVKLSLCTTVRRGP